MRTCKLNHCTYRHQYHLVWGTRYRRKYLKAYVWEELNELIFSIPKKYPTMYIHALKGGEDHVHLQIEVPPDISVAKAVQRIKWVTSIGLKKKFRFIRKIYLEGNIWSVGYFSSTLGLNEMQVKQYIRRQGLQEQIHQIRLLDS